MRVVLRRILVALLASGLNYGSYVARVVASRAGSAIAGNSSILSVGVARCGMPILGIATRYADPTCDTKRQAVSAVHHPMLPIREVRDFQLR